MTSLLQSDERYLDRCTQQLLDHARLQGGYDCRILRESALCARAVRSLLTVSKPAMHHVQAVCALMEDLRGSASVQLPGMQVVRQYHVIYFGKTPSEVPQPLQVSCREAGSVRWGDWVIRWQAQPCGADTLLIRSRQQADVIALPGGRKRVKKLLIDQKIPADQRDSVPVVICGGEIVAAAGLVVPGKGIQIEEREYDQQAGHDE